MKSVLYFWNGRALFLGKLSDASSHRYYATQICIGLAEPFNLIISDQQKAYRAIMLAPNFSHQFDGKKRNGTDTCIQKKGINHDFGVFDDPDSFYTKDGSKLSGIKKIHYKHLVRKLRNLNVFKIRTDQWTIFNS